MLARRIVDQRAALYGRYGLADPTETVPGQHVVRVVFSRGEKWTIVLRDLVGLRVLHSFGGADYVEWPVLRQDGSVVFPGYEWNGERSIKNSESASQPIPSDVVDIVKELLSAKNKVTA